ncbi:MAG: sulfite exporter TauE/SafE family protein [Bacilli bacterium]|nr:sulfite exporter TauE/SafE family protein [Bacilli bacterium]
MIKYVKIDGIHCEHCIDTITNELLKNKNIKNVVIKNNIAHITYEKNLPDKDIIDTIKKIDYFTKEEYITNSLKDIDNKIKLKEFAIILFLIIAVWFLINKMFGFNIFNVIPNIDSNITYGMLFVTGVLTSIHCISMCGAINLIAIIDSKNKNFKRPLLYNSGRVVSYTIIGGFAGLLGSVFKINELVSGIIIIIAALLMLLMSLNMLGVIDLRLKLGLNVRTKTRNPFIIGLLNGLMPCGPLQAMQVYALSTGSFIKGALSMFLFSLGTVPLMLSIGIIYNLIKGKRKILLNKIASILILILSIVMLNRGLLTLNIDITKPFNNYDNYKSSKLNDNYQIVEFDLSYNSYEDIIVQKGIPVKMIIHVDEKYLTGCNNELEIKDFNIVKKLKSGENIIEFTPNNVDTYTYTCWMNMIKNNIKVIDDINYFKGD